MKRFLLYLLVFVTLPAMAQYRGHGGHGHDGHNHQGQASSLTIVAPHHQTFWLFVDDVLQNEQSVHSIRINNLWPDEFYIRVELDNREQNCLGQFIDLHYPQGFRIIEHRGFYGLEPFGEAYAMIQRESFDDTRLTIAKQVVVTNKMMVNQIAQIARLFSFENNRLEFAKFAYPYCIEKNKYYLLYDVFDHDSSKHELNEYIQGL